MNNTPTAEAVQTKGLGKRYGRFWALSDCDVSVPTGSITALVGPNGAGKSTLLQILTGLNAPSTGASEVFGEWPAQTPEFLSKIGFLAQEIPLYKHFTVKDYMGLGAHLNKHWDSELMESRLSELHIPFDRPVGKMSGGQCAQVGLAMALAKRPKLLLLDEPVAALDPLARRDFLSSLADAVAETDLTVVMSSHLLADLEMICDRVIIMANGQIQLSDDIEHVLETHKRLVGPRQTDKNPAYEIIQEIHTPRQSTILARINDAKAVSKDWQIHDVTIEDVVLAYMEQANEKANEGGAR
jgi:ABC-2 type transport system ATP-binding protein